MQLRARASLLVVLLLVASILAIIPDPASAAPADGDVSTQSTSVEPRAKNGWAYDMVRVDEAHALGYTGKGVRVAILDNGIDPRATGITGKVVASYDAVNAMNGQQEHGTATAGIVAAETNAEAGIGGVAPDAEILNVKVCVMSNCRDEAIVPGLRWAIDNGADVISMSFGGVGSLNAGTAALIDEATKKGIIVVAAAGNSACSSTWQGPDGTKNRNCTQNSLSVGYPASFPIAGLLSVAAVDREGKRASYSSYNAQVDIAAPGTGVSTTFPWGPNADFGGTSAATPVVSGVAALVKGAAPTLTAPQIQAVLQLSATSPTESIPKVWDACTWNGTTVVWDCTNLSPAKWPARYYTGAGIVDAVAAVALAKNLEARILAGAVSAPSLTVADGAATIDWHTSGLSNGPYAVWVDGDVRGSTSGTTFTIDGLVNESSYVVSVTDAAGHEALPVVVIPTAQVAVVPMTLDRIAPTHDNMYIYANFPSNDTAGALLISDGSVAGCRQNTCDHRIIAGNYTAKYRVMGPLGYLSEPSGDIAFTSTYVAEPKNLLSSNITATTADFAWDPVPGASLYEYYDAGVGQWLETAETHASISGLNTALYSTFRVRGFNRDSGLYSLSTPTVWYFALPPELSPPSNIKATELSDEMAVFTYDANPDSERITFFRSDGKNQYQPASGANFVDRYNSDDWGKTYKYWFVSLDDKKYGTQYGQISDPVTVTVPFPRSFDRIDLNSEFEPLPAGSTREIFATVVSGRIVDWTISGSCETKSINGNRITVRATSGEGICKIHAQVEKNTSWFGSGSELSFNVDPASDSIALSGLKQPLEYGKTMDVRATVKSERAVSWRTSLGCSFKSLGSNRIRVKAESGTGSCTVMAALEQNSWWHGAATSGETTLTRTVERITMTQISRMLDRKPLVVSFKSVTGRTVSFKSSALCSVKKLSASKVQVLSKYTFGSCTVTANFAQNQNTTAASSKLTVTLGLSPLPGRTSKDCD